MPASPAALAESVRHILHLLYLHLLQLQLAAPLLPLGRLLRRALHATRGLLGPPLRRGVVWLLPPLLRLLLLLLPLLLLHGHAAAMWWPTAATVQRGAKGACPSAAGPLHGRLCLWLHPRAGRPRRRLCSSTWPALLLRALLLLLLLLLLLPTWMPRWRAAWLASRRQPPAATRRPASWLPARCRCRHALLPAAAVAIGLEARLLLVGCTPAWPPARPPACHLGLLLRRRLGGRPRPRLCRQRGWWLLVMQQKNCALHHRAQQP